MTSMLGRKFDLFMTRDLGMSASVEGMPCGGCGTDAAVRPSAYDPFFRLVSQKCKGAGKFLICQTDGKSTPAVPRVQGFRRSAQAEERPVVAPLPEAFRTPS